MKRRGWLPNHRSDVRLMSLDTIMLAVNHQASSNQKRRTATMKKSFPTTCVKYVLLVALAVTIPYSYAIAWPCIEVTKACTNAVAIGEPIFFTGTVTNCGAGTLTNVTVVDDNGTVGYFPDDVTVLGPISLAPGASVPYSGSYTPAISPSTNTVIATADYPGWPPATDTASATCTQEGGKCWLTAGGVKFSPITGLLMAEIKQNGPLDSVGGNVNPGCNPDSGEGGNWNHVAHKNSLHFQGTVIEVVRCGNIPGIEPGSESPVTPYNYIEFQGTGSLKGIGGNKADFGTVCFFAHVEDRNEPGNERALLPDGGADIDRYYLNVFDCSTHTSLLLVDMDHNPATVDPITITGGNFQIHISSCSN